MEVCRRGAHADRVLDSATLLKEAKDEQVGQAGSARESCEIPAGSEAGHETRKDGQANHSHAGCAIADGA
jgi:hypothetical protein